MENFKKHPLSLQPGGSTLRIEFKDGLVSINKLVKHPKKYADAILQKEGSKVLRIVNTTDNSIVYESEQAKANSFQ